MNERKPMVEYIAKKLVIELMHRSSYLSDGDLLEVNGNLAKARIEAEPAADVAPVVRCKDCIHNNDCDIQYSAQAGENFFCGFGETEKDVREDVYE